MIVATRLTWRNPLGLLPIAFALAALGCGGEAARQAESVSHVTHLTRAVKQYQVENMKWPDKLEDLQSMIGKQDTGGIIGGGKDFASLLKNPLTGDNPGYEYVKPEGSIPPGGTVTVIYQVRGGKRDELLPFGFVFDEQEKVEAK